ncbi:MAG: histidine kinase [Phaeodactylibacter sp.]|nr:histidine kinase [Phaeodactylibacter sp.]
MDRRLKILFHILFWTFSYWVLNMAFAFEHIEIMETEAGREELYLRDFRLLPLVSILFVGKVVSAYATIAWIIPVFFRRRNSWSLAGYTVGLVAAVLLLELLFVALGQSAWEVITFERYWQLGKFNALFFLIYYCAATGYAMAEHWWRGEQLRQALIQENLRTELDFLKSQINPHFFFNTLNNLHALAARSEAPLLSQGLEQLSQLMRYMLYESKVERVPLEKELSYLSSFIELHKLRFDESDDLTVALYRKGSVEQCRIAPLLLIPFLENAFKHGVRWDESCFIRIDMEVEEEKVLRFRIVNRYFEDSGQAMDVQSGIGLQNVRRRLELLYPDRHHLEIGRKGPNFEVLLTINLDEL